MINFRNLSLLLGLSLCGCVNQGPIKTAPKAAERTQLDRDIADFSRVIANNQKYKVVKKVEIGGTTNDKNKPEKAILQNNPFVMVNSDWQKLSMTQKRKIVIEIFELWQTYCKRSGRYAFIFFQFQPGGKTVGYCSTDDGCSSEGYAEE